MASSWVAHWITLYKLFWLTDGSVQTTAAASDQLVFRLKEWLTSPQMFSNVAAETADGSDWWPGHWYLPGPGHWSFLMFSSWWWFFKNIVLFQSQSVSEGLIIYFLFNLSTRFFSYFWFWCNNAANKIVRLKSLDSDSRNFLFGFVWISVQI